MPILINKNGEPRYAPGLLTINEHPVHQSPAAKVREWQGKFNVLRNEHWQLRYKYEQAMEEIERLKLARKMGL